MKTKRFSLYSFAPLALVALALLATQTRSLAQVWMQDNAEWKYYQVGNEPADINGKNWKQVGYDDASWGSGRSQLGFGDGDEEPSQLTRGQIAYYFRHTMTVTQGELDVYNQLIIDLLRDDGAIVYINGVEIDDMPGGRSYHNMPAGVITSSTTANATVGGGDENKYFRSTHSSSVFVPGLNTVAVEIHQASSGSSDISLQMKMEGLEVIPTLGSYTPPAFIDFSNAGDGDSEYWPLVEEKELGWWSNADTPNSQVKAVHPTNGMPTPDEFSSGQCMAVSNDTVTMKTDVAGTDHPAADPDDEAYPGAYRINLSNYKDVKVQYDLRAWTPSGGGMGTSDRARFWLYFNSDGDDVPKGEPLMDLSAGGDSEPVTELLVEESDTKRVTVPTASLGDGWHLVGYPDTSWTSGVKGTGFERSAGGTYDPYFGPGMDMETEMYSKNASVFMRVPFTVDDIGSILGLLLCMRYDDGFVAYINGTEVARKNAPGSENVAPAWNDQATASHSDSAAVVYENIDIGDFKDSLVAGDNMLAIHGLNAGKSSSDMLIETELKAVVAGGDGEIKSLNDIVRSIDGSFSTFTYDVPDSANTVWMEWELKTTGSAGNALFLDNILVSGTPLEPDTYRNWIALTTPYEIDDLGAPEADPEGDTIMNALDYAFGGSATEPDQGITPRAEIIEIEGQFYFKMTWLQLNKTVEGSLDGSPNGPGSFKVQDIRYIPQISNDGKSWRDGAPGPTRWIQIGEIEGEGDTVEVSARSIAPIESTDTRIFGRVKIEIDEFLFDNL